MGWSSNFDHKAMSLHPHTASFLRFTLYNSMFTQERLKWLTKGFRVLDLDSPGVYNKEGDSQEKCESILSQHDCEDSIMNEPITSSEISTEGSNPRSDDDSKVGEFHIPTDAHNVGIDELSVRKLPNEKRLPNAVLPLLRYHQCKSSESSSSFQGSPCDDWIFRGCADEADTEEASSSGQEDPSDYSDVFEWAKAQTARSSEEEATALSIWAVGCICGSLRLDNVLTMFAAALLEKQTVVVCSNLVGVKNKSSKVMTRLANGILVDANKNQVQSPTMPQLPKQKELISSLSPYHTELVGECYLAKRSCQRLPIGAKIMYGFSLLKFVSLLLKENFIESFPRSDRPFMKLFVDTQLFSVHTDLVLSLFLSKELVSSP
ncbi:hypothetical protein C5167_044239 [Papaver somniferum]|uniref:Uncharacterized protein n=1 Tax=Papaver somniferum TaxID=3469 RepID=A0A4Y7LAF2_PAPSO|nr:hypothetical protein C5167_044239 [Papaver somniferum]